MSRYLFQEALKQLGPESTVALAKSRVVIVGCGGTGSHVADSLARMGVGRITVIDDDRVYRNNIHRQLFSQRNIGEFKAEAVANNITCINFDVAVTPVVTRVVEDNLVDCIGKPDLILDCTDNMEIRWLINEYAVKYGIPWIYNGVGQTKGLLLTVMPGKSACLRCIWSPKDKESKATGGIFPPVVAIMANVQAAIAIKILTGNTDDVGYMRHFDAWSCNWMNMKTVPKPTCPVCGKKDED